MAEADHRGPILSSCVYQGFWCRIWMPSCKDDKEPWRDMKRCEGTWRDMKNWREVKRCGQRWREVEGHKHLILCIFSLIVLVLRISPCFHVSWTPSMVPRCAEDPLVRQQGLLFQQSEQLDCSRRVRWFRESMPKSTPNPALRLVVFWKPWYYAGRPKKSYIPSSLTSHPRKVRTKSRHDTFKKAWMLGRYINIYK